MSTPTNHHQPPPADPAPDAAAPGETLLTPIVREAIAAAGGRLTFAEFMDLALYHPVHGYYQAPQRRPGRGGDFLTAPETHAWFGLTLARQIAECWERLGQPADFTIREYGAGVGGLAYDILAGLSEVAPVLGAAVQYRLIELNPYRRAEAMAAMREVGLADQVRTEPADPAAVLPPITGVVLANEVADAFPVHRLVWRDGSAPGLRERYVTAPPVPADHDQPGGFGEVEGELSPAAAAFAPDAWLAAQGISLRDGDRIEISPAAAAWFGAAAAGLARGYTLTIDYGYAAPELYRGDRLRGLVRAYATHVVSDDPFAAIGEQDLTAHVDFSALRAAGEAAGLTAAGLTNQGAFLASLGLGDYLVALQQESGITAAEYLAAQAAVLRLIDPGGMGRFGVLLMARAAPVSPPLRGLSLPPLQF